MPVPPPPAASPAPPVTRRALLRAAGVVVAGAGLAACTTASNGSPSASSGSITASPGGPDDPDAALRLEVSADEQQLSALYDALVPKAPAALRGQLTQLGTRHTAYRDAVSPGAAVSPPSPGPLPSGVDAVTRLRRAETAAARARAAQSVRAQDPELARVLVLAGTGAAAAAEKLRTVGS